VEQTVTVTGVAEDATWNCYTSPRNGIETGLVWCAFVSAADTVTIRVSNVTIAAIDPVTRNWKIIAERV